MYDGDVEEEDTMRQGTRDTACPGFGIRSLGVVYGIRNVLCRRSEPVGVHMTQTETNLIFIFGGLMLFGLGLFLFDFIGRRQERKEQRR